MEKTEAQLSLQVEENEELSNQSYHLIKPSLIKPFEFHDRAGFVSTSDTEIIKFANELKKQGQEIPILVRPVSGEGFEYEVIFGCRRHLASLILEKEDPAYRCKAYIENDINNHEAVKKMLVENENRQDIPALVRYINANKVISEGIMEVTEYAELISISPASLSASMVLARFYLDELVDDCPIPAYLSIKKIIKVKTLKSQDPDTYSNRLIAARNLGLKNHKFINFLLKEELPSFNLSERFTVSFNKNNKGNISIPALNKKEVTALIAHLKNQL